MMTQRDKFIKLAKSQEGVSGEASERYMREIFPQLDPKSSWCATFVSWCAKNAGITEEQFPPHASCTIGRDLMKERGFWRERSYFPKTGDIVYFDWDNSGDCDHVGIVLTAYGGQVQTIEGNKDNSVKCGRYKTKSPKIVGYAVLPLSELDNQPESYAQDAVAWATENGILIGDETGDLHLKAALSRQDAAVMLYRAMKAAERKE